MSAQIVADLIAKLGPDRVRTDADTLSGSTLDTWPLRLAQREAGAGFSPPLCVVRPHTANELASALALLSRAGVTIIPRGGGSGVAGGAQAAAGAVVIDTGDLNRILHLDAENLTVTAQAGVVLADLEAWLNQRGYVCGHYPQSIRRAQLGGLVATRSAGQFSGRYGNIEDLVVGLEAVLPDGQVVPIKNVPRRSAGPDLRHLWLGSEGTLGVISAVTLQVFPTPEQRWLQAYALPTMHQGLDVIRRFVQAGWRLAVVRLYDAVAAQRNSTAAVAPGECLLLLLSEGPAGYVMAEAPALDAAVRAGGGRPLGEAPVQAWLDHRNDTSEFDRQIRMGVLVDTIEVAGPWTAIAEIYAAVVSGLPAAVPELLLVMGHSSHSYPQGTNLYFIVAARGAPDPAAVARVHAAIWSTVMDIALAHGGTICHHHGIGRLRAPWMPAEHGAALRLLRLIKAAIDPQGIMNPGVLLPED